MTRRSKRSSPKPPPKDVKATNLRGKGKSSPDVRYPNPDSGDLESGIIRNWNLPTRNINTCIAPEHWPSNESDPSKWPVDIVRLLHDASTRDLRGMGMVRDSNNDFFRENLAHEINARQARNKSRTGTVPWMTIADLQVIVQDFNRMAEEKLEAQKKGSNEKDGRKAKDRNGEIDLRRGRSKANNTAAQDKPDEVNETKSIQQDKAKAAQRGRGRPKKTGVDDQAQTISGTKRQASDLPIRPARKLRGGKSPKPSPPGKIAPSGPNPVTPANPPENSEEEEDQENEPPEPVSGRHIYGDIIKPTTIDFNPESESTAQAQTRQTRKRGRADDTKPPTEVQIDSDPRDIDATGFLSELDPKEMRRRRKPRLSRLVQDRVTEPAWSQDVPAPPDTPILTPATDGPVSGTPAAPPAAALAAISSPPARVNGDEDDDVGIDVLLQILPAVPEHATPEERRMLEDRVALLCRDVVAYKTAIREVNARGMR